MAENSIPQSSPASPPPGNGSPDPPDDVCLTDCEWQEIADCSMALYAAIHNCHSLEGDEPAELVKLVQMRFASAVHKVDRRIHRV